MRFTTFLHDGAARLGVVDGDDVIDLAAAVFLNGPYQFTRRPVVEHLGDAILRTALVVKKKSCECACPSATADDCNSKAGHCSSPNDSTRFW